MNTKINKIRVRIAPSPTGLLHLGTARAGLFNYLFSQNNNGKFVLRIEDTDLERSNKKYEKDIINGLKWLGVNWDEGPYRQSERTDIYQKYIKLLLDSGNAFFCSHSKEELEKEKQEQIKRKESPRHVCDKKARKGIIRFRSPDKKISFNDIIRGKLDFDCSLLGDISIARDEKTPLYNLAVVIDDYEMQISHVIRGEDHISNTPKQILLQEALGFNLPEYAHLPLILGLDKSKLSKRHGAVSVNWYKEEGYLPEAMVNFIVLLGWNPGTEKEIFSIEELTREFSLKRVHKSGAIFNIERLNWFNKYYIRQMDLGELTKKCLPYLNLTKKIDFETARKIVKLEQERLKKISEIGGLTGFFFKDELKYDSELLVWKKMEKKDVKNNLELIEEALDKMDNFNKESLENVLTPLAEKYGNGEIFWPLRAALTGQKASPGPLEIMEILDKKETLKRIKKAIEKL